MIWKYFNYNNKVIIQEADSLKENNYNKSWDDAISGWQEKKVKVKLLSRVRLSVTPWTVAQAPVSMEFSRQEYWSRLPFPSPEKIRC